MFGTSFSNTVSKINSKVSSSSPKHIGLSVATGCPIKAATEAVYTGRNVLLKGPPLSGKKTAANKITGFFNQMGIDVSNIPEIHPTVFSGHVGLCPAENRSLFTCKSSQFLLRQTEPYIQHDPYLLDFLRIKNFVVIEFKRRWTERVPMESCNNGPIRAFASREESKVYNEKAHAFETLVPKTDTFLLPLCQTRLSLISTRSTVFKVSKAVSVPLPLTQLEDLPGFTIHYHIFPLLDMGLLVFEPNETTDKMRFFNIRHIFPFRFLEEIRLYSYLTFLHSAAWITKETPILYNGALYRVLDLHKHKRDYYSAAFSHSHHPITIPSILLQCEKSGARVLVDPVETVEPADSMSGFNVSIISLPLRPAAHSVALADILRTPHLPAYYTDYTTVNIGVSDNFVGPNLDIFKYH
eukprot:Tbor_TRINITY_DN7462_c0_g1::TRINITY_DN7462_c0_g1_i1::g.14583::m.14583